VTFNFGASGTTASAAAPELRLLIALSACNAARDLNRSMVEGTAGEGGYMSGLSRASNRLFDQHLSPSDFAKHPCCLRKENLRYSEMIVSKAEHVIAIAGSAVEF
jgi:hypothetical protein